MEYDFSGYATRNDLLCSDGRVIRRNAFIDNDQEQVPLVWQHVHSDPSNVLGHAILENREDGVYAYCRLNDTQRGQDVKELIRHGDVDSLSIFATGLSQRGNEVIHGTIKEVSVVLSGANPGAVIDNLRIAHSDNTYVDIDDEAVISFGSPLTLSHSEEDETIVEDNYLMHADDEGGETIGEVFNTLSEKQKNAVYAIIGGIFEDQEGDEVEHGDYYDDGGYSAMKRNVFDNEEEFTTGGVLTHDQLSEIFTDAQKTGSLKDSFLQHAQSYGIENIDILFPDAKTVTPTPDWIKRDTEWVGRVINGTTHSPFSRIKSTAADITADEARAKGYVKGNLKKEEVFKLLKRVTTPTTIYKKQKLDRDDIIDITTLDVVSWIKSEMRMMLDEEIARAILLGDGRDVSDEDKINEDNIRPIWKDDDMYAHHVVLEADYKPEDFIEAVIRSRKEYKGSGNPTMFTTNDTLVDLLLLKDGMGRYMYETEAALTSKMRVSGIVEVPLMEGLKHTTDNNGETELVAIIVNLKDYVVGADKGGQISMFDDFDIDYNQYKYLMETRMSGTLVHPKSALIIEKKVGASAASYKAGRQRSEEM